MRTPVVRHGFLEGAGPPLFASHHEPGPGAPARNVAYVLCLPLHLELIQSYRSMRSFAEELAAAGFHVMRVHYDGTGESIGSTDRDADRVAAWQDSVRRAVEVMAKIPNVESVGLAGVRIGAALAMDTATRLDISHLVLWEPVSGAMYAREMEILASSAPQKVPGGVVAGGYFMSEATSKELARLDPEKMEPRGKPAVLLVYRGDRRPSPRLQQHFEKLGCATTMVQLAGHKEMMVMPHKSAVPSLVIDAIRQWAVERSLAVAEAGAATLAPAALASETVTSGVRWRTFWFGAKDHLFGVLSEPEAGPAAGRPAVLLLTGGVTPRTSGNGSYVALAQRLAAKGHVVMRMDVACIGESRTLDDVMGNGNDGFPPSVVDDARAGLERLCTAVAPGTEVWLLGLCSGAYAAFQTMLADARVRGAFLMNPVTLHLRDPEATPTANGDSAAADGGGDGAAATANGAMTKVDQLEQMQRYLQLIRDPESWKKVLTGKANVRHIAGIVGARLGARLASAKETLAVRLGRTPKGLGRDLDEVLARQAHVHLVFSEGDPGHPLVTTELGARFDELSRKGLKTKIFPGADHNFHEMASRAELLDWVVQTIDT